MNKYVEEFNKYKTIIDGKTFDETLEWIKQTKEKGIVLFDTDTETNDKKVIVMETENLQLWIQENKDKMIVDDGLIKIYHNENGKLMYETDLKELIKLDLTQEKWEKENE